MKTSAKTMTVFDTHKIRRHWDEKRQKWYFSVVDVCSVLAESIDPGAYWRKLKQRLLAEGSQTVTFCHGLKMEAPDGKMRLTDTADTEVLFRLIQSIPSPKAEPFKLWLARVGYERIEEMNDPEKALNRIIGNQNFIFSCCHKPSEVLPASVLVCNYSHIFYNSF